MTAHEHHAQLVILDRPACRFARVEPPRQLGDDLVRSLAEGGVPAQHIERAVPGDAEQPRPGVVRDAAVRPLLERLEQRVLHDFFSQLEMFRPEDVGQPGDHLSRARTEQMIDELMG